MRDYRERLKKNPEKLAKQKEKKQQQNKKYKADLKERRRSDKYFDMKCKEQQNKWKKKSRKREKKAHQLKEVVKKREAENKRKKRERENEMMSREEEQRAKRRKRGQHPEESERQNQLEETPTTSTINRDRASTTRKHAQRAKQVLPNTPISWSKTLNHLIHTASPGRKKNLQELQKGNGRPAEEWMIGPFALSKVGRPTKQNAVVKRKIAFTCGAKTAFKSKRNFNRYKKREVGKTFAKSKAEIYNERWKPKIETFLEENSRVMPNKKDTIKLNGQHVAKRHLLCTKYQSFRMFKEKYPEYNRGFTTFRKAIPRYFRHLDLTCRRICVCIKCYNLEQKVTALNKMASKSSMPELKCDLHTLSKETICPYESTGTPSVSCLNRKCTQCGIEKIQQKYRPLTAINTIRREPRVKYYQWENAKEVYLDKNGRWKKCTRWKQMEKSNTVSELVMDISATFEKHQHTEHLFRASYQHRVETQLMSAASLPQDHCVVVMDFSENFTIEPQDEIQAAHYTQKQITIHPIYIVRHSPDSSPDNPKIMKESLIVLSDNMTHDAKAVYLFTTKLFIHLQDQDPSVPIKVLHRFSDNCAVQYKCVTAFSHLQLLQEVHGVKVIYHYTEAGHGKGPSDGLGAAIKKKLDHLILGGKVINNAYQAYLALVENEQYVNRAKTALPQRIIYVPAKEIQKHAPAKKDLESVKGTQLFHMVELIDLEAEILKCQYLSCACAVCVRGVSGPCQYGQYQTSNKTVKIKTKSAKCGTKTAHPRILVV